MMNLMPPAGLAGRVPLVTNKFTLKLKIPQNNITTMVAKIISEIMVNHYIKIFLKT